MDGIQEKAKTTETANNEMPYPIAVTSKVQVVNVTYTLKNMCYKSNALSDQGYRATETQPDLGRYSKHLKCFKNVYTSLEENILESNRLNSTNSNM